MADTGTGLLSGNKVVAVAGTAVHLPSLGTAGAAKTVVVQALSTNEGKIAVGGKEVVAGPGTHAAPTTKGVLLNAGDTEALDIADTAAIWLDATVSGDGVSYKVLLA